MLKDYIEELSYHNDIFFQKDMEKYIFGLIRKNNLLEQFSDIVGRIKYEKLLDPNRYEEDIKKLLGIR